MAFDDWYSDPERGAEIDALWRRAKRYAQGEGDEVVQAIFIELVMRRAWNAACVECLDLTALQRQGERWVH